MKREDFIKKGILAAAGTSLLLGSGCASEQTGDGKKTSSVKSSKKYRWKMVTTWPPNFPVLGEAATYFADLVKEMSDGRISIKVYGGNELVPPLETFNNVSDGTVEMGSGAAYYWAGKSAAAQFFCAVPFGMNAQQMNAWMIGGGGYELWKEVYAPFNLVPFLAGSSGVQMGGWFNKEINSADDLKGLKMRIPGLAGKVLEKVGGTAILVAGGEIYTSLERGVIDATEWIGPYHDYKMGFQKIAKYYYTPGWHEPSAQLEFIINKPTLEALPKDLQAIIQAAAWQTHSWVLATFDAQNTIYLQKLKEEGKIEIREFPKEVLDSLRTKTEEVLQEIVSSDPLAKKVYTSYDNFRKKMTDWSEITEKSYYNKLM